MIDVKSIRHIRSVASQNGCVGLFPSGNGSFNGEEAYISPSIGKLVKLLNIPVILYNLDGLYFCSPRWSKHHRKGRFCGKIVRRITEEEIKTLSSEELSDIIINDLRISAYKTQKSVMRVYKGRDAAMHLQRALYTCPKCRSRGFMQSAGDAFFCEKCNYSVKYNSFGYFEPRNNEMVYFETITEWDNWQKNYLLEQYAENKLFVKDRPLYTDKNIKLYSCFYMKKNELLQKGEMKLYSDRIEIISTDKTKIFYIKDILETQAILGQILQFSVQGGEFFEIKSSSVFSALKYVHILNLIKNGSGPDGLFSI
jgi:ribosomal protein L37AE/L43A